MGAAVWQRLKDMVVLAIAIITVVAILVYGGLLPAWAGFGSVMTLLVVGMAFPPRFGNKPAVSESDGGGARAGQDVMRRAFPKLAAARDSHEAAQLLSSVAAALPDPFMVLDARGMVLICNRHATSAFEVELTGHHISTIIRAPAVLGAIDHVGATRQARRVDYDIHVPVERRFEVFVAAIAEDAGPGNKEQSAPPMLFLLLRDLTRQYRVERMRTDFIANASHELRTPLASVLGFIETLSGPAKDDEKARAQFLSLMCAQARRMSRLVNNLLSLSRIELNAHMQPADKVNLGQILHHVVESLEPVAHKGGATVKVDLPDKPPFVRGDRDELVEVFQNLVENAIKYADTDKPIEVSMTTDSTGSVDGSVVLVSVRDRGPGIAPEHLSRLTERFYRVDVQASRARGGTGLGLAIVKHILNRHRGKLIVKSKLSTGSVFTVMLPSILEEGAHSPTQAARNGERGNGFPVDAEG